MHGVQCEQLDVTLARFTHDSRESADENRFESAEKDLFYTTIYYYYDKPHLRSVYYMYVCVRFIPRVCVGIYTPVMSEYNIIDASSTREERVKHYNIIMYNHC